MSAAALNVYRTIRIEGTQKDVLPQCKPAPSFTSF